MNKVLFFLALALFFISCKRDSVPSTSFDQAPKKLEFEYLKVKSKLEYKDGKQKNKATLHIRVKKDSMIWVSVQHAIEVMRIKIDRDSLRIINRLDKKYISLSYDQLVDRLGFKLNYDFLESIITANIPEYILASGKSLSMDDMNYFLRKDGFFQFEYFVSKSIRHLEMVRVTEVPTKNFLEIDYSDYLEKEDKSIYPSILNARISMTDGQTAFTPDLNIQHSNYEVISEDEDLNFPFNVPDRYERN